MDEHSTLLYIMLSQMKGIGPVSQTSLLKLCGGDIKQCFEMDEEDLYRLNETLPAGQRLAGTKIGAFLSGRNSTEKRYEAKAVLESCKNLGISVITKEDIHYPGRFSSLPDMPCLLYVKGRLAINDCSVSAGIVGARRCTPEDKGKAILTAEQEVKKGNAIVSGMAKGIDSYAHTAALKSGGYTIAVLGNGPDICYPKEHQTLYEAIAQMGCVVSEYPPGMTPRSYMFPRRNRLIAALSDKLYIIGAGRNSGTNTTAAFCRKYQRWSRDIDSIHLDHYNKITSDIWK